MSPILESWEVMAGGEGVDKECTLRARHDACKTHKEERTPEERQRGVLG